MSIATRIAEMEGHISNAYDKLDDLGVNLYKLPEDYVQVEYIESTGTQYIDTGYIFNQNTKIKVKGGQTTTSGAFLGNRITNGNRLFLASGQQKITLYYNSNEALNTNISTGTINEIEFTKNQIIYNGTTSPITISNIPNRSIYLFGLNDSSDTNALSSSRLYYFTIYEEETLMKSFIPCYRKSDNEVGLYDIVNNVFYTNQGTGTFTAGEISRETIDKNINNISDLLEDIYEEYPKVSASDVTEATLNNTKQGRLDIDLKGNTFQQTYTGQNLFNLADTNGVTTGVTVDSEGWITATYDNTSGSSSKYLNYFTKPSNLLQTNTNYLVVVEIKEVVGDVYLLEAVDATVSSQPSTSVSLYADSLIPNTIIARQFTTKSDFSNASTMIRTFAQIQGGKSGSITFRISVIADTTVTTDTFTYEPYVRRNSKP